MSTAQAKPCGLGPRPCSQAAGRRGDDHRQREETLPPGGGRGGLAGRGSLEATLVSGPTWHLRGRAPNIQMRFTTPTCLFTPLFILPVFGSARGLQKLPGPGMEAHWILPHEAARELHDPCSEMTLPTPLTGPSEPSSGGGAPFRPKPQPPALEPRPAKAGSQGDKQ